MLINRIISDFAYIRVMIAVISGDIINSEGASSAVLMKTLKDFFKGFGKSPADWEIYRGDQFQLALKDAEAAFVASIHLKSVVKKLDNVDVRIAIGLGEKSYHARRITEANGSAFVHSGRKLDALKAQNVNLAIQSDFPEFDAEMNLFFKFASTFMDEWSAVSCEIVSTLLEHSERTQVEIAEILNINQSAVSQRRKRANFDLLMELNQHYIHRVKQLPA